MQEYDVIVLGAGGAELTAAIAAMVFGFLAGRHAAQFDTMRRNR